MKVPFPIRILLWPFSVIYGTAAQIRVLLYQKGLLKRRQLKAAVISVGNLTTGGTGKTPMVIWLAERFLAVGKSVAILSRGYRGAGGTSDEIELMRARLGDRVAFGVGADRYEEGSRIESRRPVDVFILDDGYQHVQLERNVNVLMLDGSKKLREEWLLPAGELREPISACARADLIVVTRTHERPDVQAGDTHEHHIFYAQTRLLGFRRLGEQRTAPYLNELGDSSFFAFCGLGNPQAFFNDLEGWHVSLAGTKEFRDHHRYSQGDVRQLEQLAKSAGAKALMTTEKDEQNLRGVRLASPVYVAVIAFVFPAESELEALLERLMSARSAAA